MFSHVCRKEMVSRQLHAYPGSSFFLLGRRHIALYLINLIVPLIYWQGHGLKTQNAYVKFLTLFIYLFTYFCLFKATPMTCGGSQARCQIGAVSAGLYHSHSRTGSSHVCNLHCSSRQYQILNPLSEAKDWTYILMDAGQIHFCWVTLGTPNSWL